MFATEFADEPFALLPDWLGEFAMEPDASPTLAKTLSKEETASLELPLTAELLDESADTALAAERVESRTGDTGKFMRADRPSVGKFCSLRPWCERGVVSRPKPRAKCARKLRRSRGFRSFDQT